MFSPRRRKLPLDAIGPDLSRAAARRLLESRFRAARLESPDLDARLLVCAASAVDHAGLIRDPDRPLGNAAEKLHALAARRLRGEPVSRILEEREFWSLPFTVTPAVLDPRPETEGLVGSILDAIGGRRDAALSILDLGTGSGAILAALLRELPLARGLGIDRSLAACRVARVNLAALGLAARAYVLCGVWADALQGRFDVIAANPPYIATHELPMLAVEVRDHDPGLALDGGPDGLDAYRAIVPQLMPLLAQDGIVGFECGTGQGAAIAAMLRDVGVAPAVYLDLAGHERVVIGGRSV